jgi:hypothetical protein
MFGPNLCGNVVGAFIIAPNVTAQSGTKKLS